MKMRERKLPYFLFVCFFFSLFLASLLQISPLLARPVLAQTEVPTPSDDDVNAIARQMYCPVCENVPLDVCETKACEQWRELIREKLAAGWTEDQIKDYFVLQYGDRVLAEPPRRGLNWLVYILPPVFFLAGAYILYRVLKQMRKKPEKTVSAEKDGETSDPYVSRIEEALRERRK
jgi:cytochrome c-type biogenesis protein CcmH